MKRILLTLWCYLIGRICMYCCCPSLSGVRLMHGSWVCESCVRANGEWDAILAERRT